LSVSGTLLVNCGWFTARKVLAETKNMPGVTLVYRTDKRPNGPNVIVNMSGVSEERIREVKEYIWKIDGVNSVTIHSGRSLLRS
jgi:hypothetical protein